MEAKLNDEQMYRFIEEYASKYDLKNLKIALPLAKDLLVDTPKLCFDDERDDALCLLHYQHSLSVCMILIDLQVPISKEEEDILLSVGMCHYLIEDIPFPEQGRELTFSYELDNRVYEVVRIITRNSSMSQKIKTRFYERIQQNKMAILVMLADRGNLVEHLYGMSVWHAREYVRETRNFFLPMCIYAKEHHTDVHMIVNILMEKMKCLIDVADILTSRYQARETSYTNEILTLQEENARIRAIIEKLKAEKNCNDNA